MFSADLQSELRVLLGEIRDAGLHKEEKLIRSSQDAMITLEDGREVLNMCANNYLGLANHPEVVEAARKSLGNWGFGIRDPSRLR